MPLKRAFSIKEYPQGCARKIGDQLSSPWIRAPKDKKYGDSILFPLLASPGLTYEHWSN